MKYYVDNKGNFIIKITKYKSFIYYKALLNNLQFEFSFNNSTLEILLRLKNIEIINEISNRIKLSLILSKFNENLINLHYRIIRYLKNILIIKDIRKGEYLIFGLEFSNLKLNSKNNINNRILFKNIFGISDKYTPQYLIYTNNVSKPEINAMKQIHYNNKINILNYGNLISNGISMGKINTNTPYLSSVLDHIYTNKEILLKLDYIIIFNEKCINQKIFNKQYITYINEYSIIGSLIEESITKNSKYIKIIQNKHNFTKVSRNIFNKIYSSFKYIIFDSVFLSKYINEIKNEPIDVLSMKCVLFSNII